MKALALTLALCLLSRTALGACAETDTDCLLKRILEQSYELEAERQRSAHLQRSNDLLQEALKQEEARDNGPKFFLMGMAVGVVFVGLGATIAMKAIKEARD